MREIKFRAWDKINDKILNYGTDEACEVWEDGCDYMGMSFITHQPNIIWMQYTGLKDENNKDIFEGDILNLTYMVYAGHGTVDEVMETVVIDDITKLPFGPSTIGCEVIGNIYENPELLEGESHGTRN